MAKAKQLLNEIRNKMKEEEAAKTKRMEKVKKYYLFILFYCIYFKQTTILYLQERIQVGKEIQKARSKKEELEMAEAIKEREKEKREAAEAKKRILAQIAADKEERKRKNEEFRISHDSKPQEPETSCQKRPKLDTNQSRIQFKLPNGTSLNGIFNANDDLGKLYEFVSSNSSYKSFTLSLTYPKKIFTPEERTKSLRDLELLPSACILVIVSSNPANKVTSVVSSSIFSQIWNLFFAFIPAIWAFVVKLISPSRNPQQPDAAAEAKRLEERKKEAEERAKRITLRQKESKFMNKEGNIARLQDNRDNAEDDENTWNGNSTQQM